MRVLLFFTFLVFGLFSCQKTVKTTYENGQTKEEYTVNDKGEKNGFYERYLENGTLIEESNFVNGLQHGKRRYYYENGNLEFESDYVNDLLTGKHLTYYDTGELLVESTYKNSEVVGIFKKYYRNGNLEEEVTFVEDLENGPFKEYYENGSIKWKGNYLNGDNEFGIIEQYNIKGELIKKMKCDSMSLCKTIWEKDQTS